MGRKRTRRQQHGSAWHWQQTDCWYYTLPGTKNRLPLFDEEGNRIRGKDNKQAAQLALARLKLAGDGLPAATPAATEEWLVARVCSEYLQYCERGLANAALSKGHRDGAVWVLNDLCAYCGALPVAQLKKGHVETWVGQHPRWKSPATRRSVLSVVLAAFNYTQANFDIANPLKGLKKPHDCPAFGKECTPQSPLGATMVSAEGACAAYHAYGRHLAVYSGRPRGGAENAPLRGRPLNRGAGP